MKLTANQRKRLHSDPRRGGWVQVGLMVLSIGLSYLAGQMLRRKNRSPIEDDKPTTLSTRGSYTPWFIGIRRVGPVFCGAWDREKRKEEVDGFKGLSSPKQDVWYESGFHVLGTGPCHALHQIVQGGRIIFQGPITNESHPSGTTVDLGEEGVFSIYWGESNQPINNFLGDATRIGIRSRWPFAFYVEWNKKRMGPSPVWPILDYVVERRPTLGLLTQSDSWYRPNLTLSGNSYPVFDSLSSAVETTGYLQFLGDIALRFLPGHFFELTGNGLPDGTYEVLRTEVVQAVIGTTSSGYEIYNTSTRVYLQGGTLGANDNGDAEPYIPDDSDGSNIAHIIAEMLFAPRPRGLGKDPNHIVERWDLQSLEDLGVESEADEWRASVLASEGETAESMLGAILQDHGVMLPIDTADGELLFYRVREPSGTLPHLVSHLYSGTLPEIESIHGEQSVDKLTFTFSDRSHFFSDMTIVVDDDGQASLEEHARARKVPIVSTVRFDTAAKLSELRSPEELAQSAEFRLTASREARDLIPGDAITAADFDEVLRVTSVQIDEQSEAVEIRVLPDFYGARKSDFVTNQGGGRVVVQDPELDPIFHWLEVPEQVLGGLGSAQTILVPRVRAHLLISSAAIWLSRDNSTYTLFGSDDDFVQTGGITTSELPATGPTFVAQGPEYTELGPDNGTLTQDLSADLTNWGLGRQLCVIASTAGVEICYLQKATVTGGSTRRLDGLLRARYDTRKLTHPAGAKVFIFDRDAIEPVQDVLLEPGEDLWVKTQPASNSGQVNLSAVPPIGDLITGKGQVPIRPDYVRVRAPALNVPAYRTGNDITVAWGISTGTPGTGAGLQGAGVAIGPADIPGSVQLEFLTSGGVLRLLAAVSAEIETYTLTNAALVAAFGSEPSSFRVRITHVANGQLSTVSPTLTITRVA